jgi:DNA-binding MarR family transcriptional regulator
MPSRTELSALLSQALVAFTIELDNEFEHLMQRWTTDHDDSTGADDGAPWLVSMVMWCNCMRFLRPEGMTVQELEQLARTPTNLAGMQRWGYLVVEPGRSADGSPILAADLVIRPTPGGRRAQFFWGPLPRLIEDRWRQRFGEETVERLRRALWGVVGKLETPLPNCMPILHQAWTTTVTCTKAPAPRQGSDLRLSALLARALLAFAVPFERRSDLSLAISANAVRVLSAEFVRVRDVPRMAGVATEATRIALGQLDKRGHVEFRTDVAAGRGHLVRLTDKGVKAQSAYRRLVSGIESEWRDRFGAEVVDELRETLEPLAAAPTANGSPPLFQGIEPYPNGWRAAGRRRQHLPHFPVVLSRGGFPDGA